MTEMRALIVALFAAASSVGGSEVPVSATEHDPSATRSGGVPGRDDGPAAADFVAATVRRFDANVPDTRQPPLMWPPKSPNDLGPPSVAVMIFQEARIWNIMKGRDVLDRDMTLLFAANDRLLDAAKHSGLSPEQVGYLKAVMRKRWHDGLGFVFASP
jgi:hypothetical protein